MACLKLDKTPLFRICSGASQQPPFPNCIHIPITSTGRIAAHLNAIHKALELEMTGCLIAEDTIDIAGSLAQWRFSLHFLLNHASVFHQKKKPPGHHPILQLYSDNIARVNEQVHVFRVTHQWIQPKTAQDTNGGKCYYIPRSVMSYLVQAFSTFSGAWNVPSNFTLDHVLFHLPAAMIQIPVFFEHARGIREHVYNLQTRLPILFHDRPETRPFLPVCAKIMLNGFHPQSFTTPGDFGLAFLSDLFRYSVLWPFDVVHDIQEANILIEHVSSRHPTESMAHRKAWDLAIQFSHEPYALYPISFYDMTIADLSHTLLTPLDIHIPTFAFQLHEQRLFDAMLNNTVARLTTETEEAATKENEKGGKEDEDEDEDTGPIYPCFLDLNEKPSARACLLIDRLLEKGLLHSYGSYQNNFPPLLCSRNSREYRDVLKQYHFILCFESTDKTAEFIEPLLLRRIPILDGSIGLVLHYFNHRGACFFGNHETDGEAARQLCRHVELLLQNPGEYQKMVNMPRVSKSGNFENLDISVLQSLVKQNIDRHFRRETKVSLRASQATPSFISR